MSIFSDPGSLQTKNILQDQTMAIVPLSNFGAVQNLLKLSDEKASNRNQPGRL